MSDQVFVTLVAEIMSAQAEFFGKAQTLRNAIAVDSPEDLLRRFSSGTTKARATLHLARVPCKLGHIETARKFVDLGMALAGERATILQSELRSVLEQPIS